MSAINQENWSLNGRVAIVTGGSRGIGAAISLRLALQGAAVAITYQKEREKALEVVEKITSKGGRAQAFQVDMRSEDDIRNLFIQIESQFNRLDILVNNAAIFSWATLEDLDFNVFDDMLAVNLRGPVIATAQAISLFKRHKQDGKRIINISSSGVQGFQQGASAYVAGKAALEALTRVHAAELAPLGVTVNCVASGPIQTELMDVVLPTEAAKAELVRRTLLNRIGQVEDIADIVGFLASDAARWITGETIRASGGLR